MKALEVENLKVIFPTEAGIVRAVEGIDIEIDEGECVAIVGESGCGKSVTSLAVMKLLSSPPAITRVDKLVLGGIDIKDLTDKQMQKVRGKDVAMIFQDALTALNPVMTVGRQIDEIFLAHGKEHFSNETGKALSRFARKKEAKRRTIEALKLVGISDAELRYKAYPHQLSGGNAPARAHRHGICLQSAPDHRGRADDRARRHHSGAGARYPQRVAAQTEDIPHAHYA